MIGMDGQIADISIVNLIADYVNISYQSAFVEAACMKISVFKNFSYPLHPGFPSNGLAESGNILSL